MSYAARREVVRTCRRLYERGLIAGGEGNVSVRLDADRVLITPRGVSKGALAEGDLVELRMSGERARGALRPSSEMAVHMALYRVRTDVRAVVHAHPPTATGFATAGETLPSDALPEVTLGLGPVALVAYGRPGTVTLADRVADQAAGHDVFLLANHGAVTVGATLAVAHQHMESLEHAARILLVARLLGGPARLSDAEVAALLAERREAMGARIRPDGARRGRGR